MYLLIKIIIFIFSISLTSCYSQKKNSISGLTNQITNINTNAIILNTNNTLPQASKKTLSEILQVVDFQLGDPIILDNPKRFIQISILFTVEQYINYYNASQIKKMNDNQIGVFLNKKREDFYKKLGISEDEYIHYSVNHGEEIQEFLASNLEFSQAYEASIDQVTD